MKTSWSKLQNGSDIRGVALEGVKNERVNLTEQAANKLGKAFASWLESNTQSSKRVAVGTDSRISGMKLKKAFMSGLTSMGYDVIDCGLASTPAMFMTTIDPNLNVTGGVMLTASHLPFNRNGMKFFTEKGGFEKQDIREILEIADSGVFSISGQTGNIENLDFISIYSEFLIETIRKGVNDKYNYNEPLAGLRIIVDAGNGAGGFFAKKVLQALGADTTGSQFLNPDGRFPNHVPNPEDKEAMDSICKAVLEAKADLGIIFDTDVDRAAMVDRNGKAINRNDLIALISAVVLEEHPGTTIVTDSITSSGLKKFIEEDLKGTHHRFKRGYKNVINESKRLNEEGKESWLAIETSGHAALKENYFLDDGAFLIAKLLIQAAKMHKEEKELGSLISKLKQSAEDKEFRLAIQENDFLAYGENLIEDLSKKIKDIENWELEEPNYEGVRVNCLSPEENGWFLLRMSLHDPVMPLNIESNVEGGVDKIKAKLLDLLQAYNGIDSRILK